MTTDPPSPTQQRVDAQIERLMQRGELLHALDVARAERDEARAARDRLAALLRDLAEEYEALPDHGLQAPEDAHVLFICEQYGFGAVMSSASRQWRRRDPSGAIMTGPCYATAARFLSRIDAALAGSGARPAEEVAE